MLVLLAMAFCNEITIQSLPSEKEGEKKFKASLLNYEMDPTEIQESQLTFTPKGKKKGQKFPV